MKPRVAMTRRSCPGQGACRVRAPFVLLAILLAGCSGGTPDVTASNWSEADALFHD